MKLSRSAHVLLVWVAVTTWARATPSEAAPNPFTRRNALAKLGRSSAWAFFALKTRVPSIWKRSSLALYSDPNHLVRLEVEDSRVTTGWMLGKKQYFKHPVLVLLLLKGPTSRGMRSALERFTKARLKNLLVAASFRGWPVTWKRPRYSEYPLSGGRRLAVYLLTGVARPGRFGRPLGLSLVSAMVLDGKRAAIFATGLATDTTFNGLSARARQVVMRRAGLVAQQVMSAASLAHIRLPARYRGLERRLARMKRFLHASRYSSSVGTMSTTSFSQHRVLDIRFLPRRTCTIRDDFSSSYTHSRRSIHDSPGTAPRRTHGAGGGRLRTPRSRWEVRRGKGGIHWLVVYLPPSHGGPTFYKVQLHARRRCGRRTIRGLAIGGRQEGIFSTWRGWCVYKPSRRR